MDALSVCVSAWAQQSAHPETICLRIGFFLSLSGLLPLCTDDFASQPMGAANPAFFLVGSRSHEPQRPLWGTGELYLQPTRILWLITSGGLALSLQKAQRARLPFADI